MMRGPDLLARAGRADPEQLERVLLVELLAFVLDLTGQSTRLRADLGARVRSADAIERRPVRVSSGVAALDAVLGGGLARGAMVEATGSGRASLALQAAAAATGRGALVAWVDAA